MTKNNDRRIQRLTKQLQSAPLLSRINRSLAARKGHKTRDICKSCGDSIKNSHEVFWFGTRPDDIQIQAAEQAACGWGSPDGVWTEQLPERSAHCLLELREPWADGGSLQPAEVVRVRIHTGPKAGLYKPCNVEERPSKGPDPDADVDYRWLCKKQC